MRNVFLFILASIILEFAFTSAASGTGRALRFSDLLANWDVISAVSSPASDQYAVVVRRPWSHRAVYGWNDWFDDISRTDVWVVDAHTKKFRNISHGELDGSANFGPVWSPSGKLLAFASTRSGESGRIYVWDRTSGRVLPVAARDLALGVNFGSKDPYSGRVAFVWLDGKHLLTAFTPQFGWKMPVSYRSIYEQGLRQWRITARGSSASVSVLGGPETGPHAIKERVDLAIVDVSSQAIQVIAEGPFGGIALSPHRDHFIVFADAEAPELKDLANIRFPTYRNSHSRLEYYETGLESYVLDARGNAHFEWRSTLPNHLKVLAYSATFFPVWSDDERFIGLTAAPAMSNEPKEPMGELLVMYGETGRVVYRDPARLGRAYWQGSRLVYVRSRGWTSVLPELGTVSEISGPIPPVETNGTFPKMWPLDTTRISATMVFQIADGKLWELSRTKEGFTCLDDFTTRKYLRFVPSGSPAASENGTLMLEGETGFYRLDAHAKATTATKIMTTSTGDRMLSYNDKESMLLGSNNDFDLAVSLVGQKNGIKSPIATFNHHWRDIRDPERKTIEYEDASGRRLRGEICFPLDYKVGQDRPTIVVVYLGWAPSLTSKDLSASKKAAWFWNLARFTSAGFLVFRPEIPMDPGARTLQDNIVDAVLAGMKKYAADGYGKAGRFGIYGHSYGSIAALTLLSRTKLFDAGVSAASYSNLFAYHDFFSQDLRYSDDADTYQIQKMAETEDPAEKVRLGGPPSILRDAYLEASPYFSADAITAPLMLVHGELDFTQIENAEMVYNALRRQGKVVELVRYWGEGHIYQSPANVKDMWHRENEWFERFLGSPHPTKSAATTGH